MSIRDAETSAETLPELPLLWRGAAALGVTLTAGSSAQFRRYAEQLRRDGGRAGVSSVTDLMGIQRRHLLESLALFACLRRRGLLAGRPLRVADLGTGGGLPGIPLAIVLPEANFTLVEASRRKAVFLRAAAEAIGLTNVVVVAERAEDLARRDGERESYDLVVSRAVASLPVLVELSLPFLVIGGSMTAIKGSGVHEEVARSARALALCGGGVSQVVPLVVPGGEERLSVVIIAKVAATPGAYPRRAGVPARRPL